MKNPATNKNKDDLNEFTKIIFESQYIPFYKIFVRLRNGFIVQPEFKAKEDENCFDAFVDIHCKCYWNMDGTSIYNRELDMMEIVWRSLHD